MQSSCADNYFTFKHNLETVKQILSDGINNTLIILIIIIRELK